MCICLANIYLGRKRRILAHPTIMLTVARGRNCSCSLWAVTLKTGRLHFWLKAGKMLGLANSVLVKRRFVISSPYRTPLPGNYTWGCERKWDSSRHLMAGSVPSPYLTPVSARKSLWVNSSEVPHFLRLTPNNTGTLIFLFFFFLLLKIPLTKFLSKNCSLWSTNFSFFKFSRRQSGGTSSVEALCDCWLPSLHLPSQGPPRVGEIVSPELSPFP